MSVLAKIVAAKRAEVEAREAAVPRALLERGLSASDRAFSFPRAPRPALIAEIKRRSPSKGWLRPGASAAEIARIYDRHASAISVVTDAAFFGGDHAMLTEARAASSLPILMKDFVLGEYQVIEARAKGADAILLMASVLPAADIDRLLGLARSMNMEALVEVHDEAELEAVLRTSAKIIGVNNRDLGSLEIDRRNFHRLAPKIDRSRARVAESGIESREELDRLAGQADAVLIGTAFMAAPDIEARVRELGW